MIFFLFITIARLELVPITILGTNDVHGRITPMTAKKENNITINIGGLGLLSSYIKILHEDKKKNLLWLDAGDQFTGTLES